MTKIVINIGKEEETPCPRCKKNLASEYYHSCAFEIELNDNDDDEFCNCCDDCRCECAMDV